MPRPHLILLRCFAGPHQVSQGLRSLIRNPHRRQISGSIATCQLHCIPPIRLNPITCLTGTSVGATTSHSMPSSASCQYTT
jgi:hypothetical protein